MLPRPFFMLAGSQGTSSADVVGVQVPEVTASLNSMDSFVLVNPTHVYSWHGKGALPAENDSANKVLAPLVVCGASNTRRSQTCGHCRRSRSCSRATATGLLAPPRLPAPWSR